jgi:hypothetical protein
MKLSRLLRILIIFICGFIAGVAASFLFLAIMIEFTRDTPRNIIKNQAYKYGYIQIWKQPPFLPDGTTVEGVSTMLMMAKDGEPFLSIHPGPENDKIYHLSLLAEDMRVYSTMTSSSEHGKWERLVYAGGSKDLTTGISFLDIDCDGHFDIKNTFNENGEKVLVEIYIDNSWVEVDRCNYERARSENTIYIFDPNSGWYKG